MPALSTTHTGYRIKGVLAPVLTPFAANLKTDVELFIAHCRWLVSKGVGLAIFGTNSEAASMSTDERIALTDALLATGIPATKMMPGTGSCTIADTVRLTSHAVQNGAAGVLMVPPFYFKGVSDDGLFAYYSEIIEQVGDDRLAVYLYHIPQFTQVPISLALIERLLKRYPGAIAGAKDSSGDWDNSRQMIEAFATDGFDVFPASESFLPRALEIGGAGCISATVNMNPEAIQNLYTTHGSQDNVRLQVNVDLIRKTFQSVPIIPAMKYVMSEFTSEPAWRNVRPPLVPLNDDVGATLLRTLSAAEFSMPGLSRVRTQPQLDVESVD